MSGPGGSMSPGTAAPWDSARYLRFEAERTLPCRDLVHRIELASPARIVDLGCGPGNSTRVLADRWPSARVAGVDHADEMLRTARASSVAAEWIRADLADWHPDAPVELVFSNAALHWLPDHRRLVPRLFEWVAPGGALAFQVPARSHPPPAWLAARDAVLAQPAWRAGAWPDASEANVLPMADYYEALAGSARRIDLWDTEYVHVLEGPAAVIEWIRGTALRPGLAQLASDAERSRFLDELTRAIAQAYPRRSDGSVLFPFRRRFLVAYR